MLALQAEVLELAANPQSRARGAVIEAELHKGMGNVATILVQNGTLRRGDALVFNQSWGRVKTMKNEFGKDIDQAGPSAAARITGLSSLPEAGEGFIVVSSEREARDIAQERADKIRQKQVQTRKKFSMESILQQSQKDKKTLNCILRADVQGSLEALRFELLKVQSDKVDISIISQDIGEISESDVQLASASGSVIIGFHTRIEAHAEGLIKSLKVKIRQFDVIYHAVDGVREMMTDLLDKIAEEHHRGRIEVKALFKSSQLGKIAGCQVIEGTILRSYRMRVLREGKSIWEGSIASLRRGKDDVREISKGFECGVLLNGFSDFEPGDILEAFEIIYRAQSL
jgi:translation initiation factor IF-2